MLQPLRADAITPGKILILCSVGIVAIADNVTGANKIAKNLAEKHQQEFTVYAPKTGFAPETPPIKRKRYPS